MNGSATTYTQPPPRRRRKGRRSQEVLFMPTVISLSIVLIFIFIKLATIDTPLVKSILENSFNKTVVITGASSGIGLDAVKNIYLHHITTDNKSRDENANSLIIMGCRNMEKCEKARDGILKKGAKILARCDRGKDQMTCAANDDHIELVCVEVDLESNQSVRKFAKKTQNVLEQFHRQRKTLKNRKSPPSLDVLINNAGVMGIPEERVATHIKQGSSRVTIDKTMQVNHVGHFLLTSLLMQNLISSEGGRVINVSSLAGYMPVPRYLEVEVDDFEMQEQPYNSISAYRQSKRANLLFTQALNDRFHNNSGLISVATHPGYSRTSITQGWSFAPNFVRELMARNPIGSMSSSDGSFTTLQAAFSKRVLSNRVIGPIFITFGKPISLGSSLSPFPSWKPINSSAVDALWRYSEFVIGEKFYHT